MRERLETLKYTFTVEGETEQWYLFWLRDQINGYAGRTYNVAFDIKVQQSPRKFYKGISAKMTPTLMQGWITCQSIIITKGTLILFFWIISSSLEASVWRSLRAFLTAVNCKNCIWTTA